MMLGRILRLSTRTAGMSPSTSMVITAVPPLLGAGEAEAADVHPGVGHKIGHGGDGARLVLVEDHQGVALAGDVDRHAV